MHVLLSDLHADRGTLRKFAEIHDVRKGVELSPSETPAINADNNPSVRQQVIAKLESFHILVLAIRHHCWLPPSAHLSTSFTNRFIIPYSLSHHQKLQISQKINQTIKLSSHSTPQANTHSQLRRIPNLHHSAMGIQLLTPYSFRD